MTDEFDNLLWAYRAVFTQTNAGGGNVIAGFTATERTVLLYGMLGQDNYAANRSISVFIYGPSGNKIAIIMFNAAIDNQFFSFPVDDISVAAANDGPQFEKRIVLGKGDRIAVEATSLIQNETVTVTLRALIRDWPPTVATTGSTGTVTTTETYNKVI